MRPNAAKVVSSALLGLDGSVVTVGSHAYYIQPPTIKKLAGVGLYLSDFGKENSLGDYFSKMKDIDGVCKALSWLIKGDESLTEELKEGTLDEIVKALESGLSLIGAGNFYQLSLLGKSVQKMIANQR